MNPEVVYLKTDKGREEIATRKFKLSLKLRAILIMVDGARRVRDLAAENEGSIDVVVALQQLQDQGFIAVSRPAAKPAAPTSRPVATVAPAPKAARQAPPPAPAPHGFEVARDTAVRLLQEAMGRDASNFAPRLQACSNGEDLLAAAERYSIVIGSTRDKNLGESYLQQVRAALQPA